MIVEDRHYSSIVLPGLALAKMSWVSHTWFLGTDSAQYTQEIQSRSIYSLILIVFVSLI